MRRLTHGVVAAVLGVSALATPAWAQVPAQPAAPPVTAAPTPAPAPAVAPEPDPRPAFADWLAAVRQEALSRGIKPDIVEQALSNIQEPLPVVLERDRAQAEIVLPLETYVNRRLTRKVIAAGRSEYAEHKALLADIEQQYGVPARIIVAIWGVESNYGRFSGVRPTVAALATLAWDPRRATFFRGELFNALEILNRGDIEFANMKGSWAGAMGQPQFMPSSYLQYAEDHDGDGRRDIWASPADVFASIANYLRGHGWTRDQRWGREVTLSPEAASRIAREVAKREGTCRATRDMSVVLPLEEWNRLGVRAVDGTALPTSDISASLVSGATRHFLVYGNYDVLLTYNCAHAYALSVAMLGDAVAGATPLPAAAGAGAKPAARRSAPRNRTTAKTAKPASRSVVARTTARTSAKAIVVKKKNVRRPRRRGQPGPRAAAAHRPLISRRGANRSPEARGQARPLPDTTPDVPAEAPVPSPAPAPPRIQPGPVVRVSDVR